MGEHRAGFVAVAGRTNVGKSTLVNRLVGHKVAIVTPRPQTTRRRILGIRSDADAQILLIDTPGLHEAKKQLNQRMVQIARRAIAEGEVILAVVEAGDHLDPGDRAVLVDIRALGRPTVVAINKVDRIRARATAAADRGNQSRLSRRRDRAGQRAHRRKSSRSCS